MSFIDFLKYTINFFINSWGLTLALVGYVLQKFFVPQILDYRKVLKRARYDVIYYANIMPIVSSDGNILNKEELDSASKELRVIASKIISYRDDIHQYDLIAKITKLMPRFNDSEVIATGFIGWSNEIFDSKSSGRYKRRKQIADALGMKHF